MDFEKEYNSPVYCKTLLDKIQENMEFLGRDIRFMEVCGTHTAALFQTGLRSLLPSSLHHISGPGCPVCVTHEDEVETFMAFAGFENIILATFGDLIRVPNAKGESLKTLSFAKNSRFEIIYSPQDALTLAKQNPNHTVIFLGIGFETTAPIIAATIMQAKAENLKNFTVFSMHKSVAPALHALLQEEDSEGQEEHPSIDIFLLPGHVACITGVHYFDFISKQYKKPAVVAGFEALDLAYALNLALEQIKNKKAETLNAYTRAVNEEGNSRALDLMSQVFEIQDASWRGLGLIPQSGLSIRKEFEDFNILKRFDIPQIISKPSPCLCGSVLKGHIAPPACPLFAKACTPQKPLGPCMVSTEGACASYYRYLI